MADAKKFAYVSFITNDQWLMGLTLMLHSLARFDTAHDRVVLVTEGVSKASRAKLTAKGAKVIAIDTITSKAEGGVEHVPSWTELGYTKLQIWGLTQYDKILYIDADCLVMDSLDEVFERDVDFAAAPDVFPPDNFNAGIMLLKPDKAVLQDMLAKSTQLPSYDGGDTGFLNAYFSDWYTSPAAARLPFGYNAQRTLHWMTFKKNPGYWNAIKPLKKPSCALLSL